MGTIGNISFISAIFCMLLTVSFLAFVFIDKDKKINRVLHILSVLMRAFIFGIINVQSGWVAFLAAILVMFPFVVSRSDRFARFMIMIATILTSYGINVIINPVYHYGVNHLIFEWQLNRIVILYIITVTLILYLALQIKNLSYDISNNEKIVKIFYGVIAGGVALVFLLLYLVDFKIGILSQVHELLHGNFDDEFGTYRIFFWKRTLMIFSDFWLIGSGPDSFAIRFMARFRDDIANLGELTLNDTAANVYITMMINIGLVGTITYLAFIATQIKEGIKRMNIYSVILLIAIICYLVSDVFNLSVVIVTLIFWMLMAMHYRSLNDKGK